MRSDCAASVLLCLDALYRPHRRMPDDRVPDLKKKKDNKTMNEVVREDVCLMVTLAA